MNRPVGLSAGVLGLAAAWAGGIAILRLTGAAPVMVVLAIGLALAFAGIVSGWWVVARSTIGRLDLPTTSTVGEPVQIRLAVTSSFPLWVELLDRGETVASGWTSSDGFVGNATMARRGLVDHIDVRVRSAGPVGLVWWGRRVAVQVADHLVAPRPCHGRVRVDTAELGATGDVAGLPGASAGDVDGVRPWRDGDAEHAVHWPSSLRSGELIVRDRLHDTGGVWIVRAQAGSSEPELECGRVRRALEDGLRIGAKVYAAVGDGPVELIPDHEAAARWTARVDLGETQPTAVPWWRREVHLGGVRPEPETTAAVNARWWAAGSTWISLSMLIGALGYSSTVLVASTVGVALGAAASARALRTGEALGGLVRSVIAVGAFAAIALVAASSGRFDGLLEFLRGPLPQVLIVLIVLHGFECRDRRTVRVALAIAAVVVMYSSGFRVDDRVGWWIAGWSLVTVVALFELSRPTQGVRKAATTTGWLGRLGGLGVAGAGVLAILSVVPVPDGPARLTFPTFVADDVDPVGRPGALVGPDGEVRESSEVLEPGSERAPAGAAGGYTGFASVMDTSVRGELGDAVVMRVRAPAPDFWRGQTFARFDGRTWYAEPDLGVLRDGPDIEVSGARGDIGVTGPVQEFVQTYFLETDMPNLVFHAYRPTRVILDADVWVRPDGALRASSVLPEGSVYTVVSSRALVDADALEQQGLIEARLSDLGRRVLAPYLELPESTSAETVALAEQLAAGRTSTYEVIASYTEWMGANVEYDLDAPLPDPGEDAVHDFLFDSRTGFCEQIASAMTIMLRTRGVPARLATGYLPGSRDRIAGVFEVKASDAHAWVEVWFPETGWQAFDPTASVPLSADSAIGSIGGDLLEGLAHTVAARWRTFVAVLSVTVLLIALVGVVRRWLDRRRRGRWGVLQDRFSRLATGRGAPEGLPNGRLASWWQEPEGTIAREVADQLDRVAFDPDFDDDDESFRSTRDRVGSLGDRRG